MKRKLTFCLIIALIFAVLVPIAAFAASDRANFIDEDNNGICDNAAQRGCGNGNVNGRCGGMQRNGCQARCK